jgi:hypothetical protein
MRLNGTREALIESIKTMRETRCNKTLGNRIPRLEERGMLFSPGVVILIMFNRIGFNSPAFSTVQNIEEA